MARRELAVNWQPIETVPKDGFRVDLLIDGERVPDARFTNGKWWAWREGLDGDFYIAIIHGTPSHWMRPTSEPIGK